jgi:NAD(P)-dependent dehydrogenase (short-subunit alcohol dehydrogenase family)
MPNELRFDGRVAVVTGAGRGLGRAHAMLLASRGAKVVVNDLGGSPNGEGTSAEPAEAVVEEIRELGGEALVDTHDVVADGEAVVETALEAWGRIDVLVNNAGYAGGGLFHEMSPEDFATVSKSHYDGTVNVTRRAWREMVEAQYGRVVITSSSSVFGMPFTSPYVASKGALFSLGRGLAKEGAFFGIKVNTLMPVAYSRLTEQQPQKKLVKWLDENFQPEGCAPFVGLLAHEDVPCTGETFVGGGGRIARVILGEGRGFEGASTPEDYRDHFDRVMSLDEFVVLEDTHQNLLISAKYMGADLTIE